jgi:hypothetical protein
MKANKKLIKNYAPGKWADDNNGIKLANYNIVSGGPWVI